MFYVCLENCLVIYSQRYVSLTRTQFGYHIGAIRPCSRRNVAIKIKQRVTFTLAQEKPYLNTADGQLIFLIYYVPNIIGYGFLYPALGNYFIILQLFDLSSNIVLSIVCRRVIGYRCNGHKSIYKNCIIQYNRLTTDRFFSCSAFF